MTQRFRGIASGLIALAAILFGVLGGEPAQTQGRELTMGNVNPPKHGTSLATFRAPIGKSIVPFFARPVTK